MARVLIDPLSRIEGHMSIEIDVQNGKVVDAKSRGDMYRGFENILKNRNPLDSMQITQRICGVCPISHGIASVKNLDSAFGIKPNSNGRLLRNLTLSANYLQSHILHFYHLAALDYVDIKAVLNYKGNDRGLQKIREWAKQELEIKKDRNDALTSVAPFLPRYEGDFYIKDQDLNIAAIAHFIQALEMRMKAHRMVVLFGGKAPHAMGLVPGGVTQVPTVSNLREYRTILEEVEKFINTVYIPDVIAVAKAYSDYFKIGTNKEFLAYGVFNETDEVDKKLFFERGVFSGGTLSGVEVDKITEHVKYARYSSPSGLHPSKGETRAAPDKAGAYTWLKAPRYDGKALEVGPLARVVVAYHAGNKRVKEEVDGLLKVLDADISAVFSTLGRHASRAIESKILCERMKGWLDEVDTGKPPRSTFTIPDSAMGFGLTEAPRGALGHWINIKGQKIANYQCVVPTTWNAGPTDDRGNKGPIEAALIGTPISDPANPIEAARVVRSYDPCIACAVHVMEGDREIGSFRIL